MKGKIEWTLWDLSWKLNNQVNLKNKKCLNNSINLKWMKYWV